MKPVLVGIAGPSCSGKTTLVKEIANELKDVEVIHADDYWDKKFKPPIINGYKNRELPENVKYKLLYKHLLSLKRGNSVEIPHNVFQIENGKKIAKPKKLIVVEGFLLFYHKKVRDLFDLKIYFDVSDEDIIKRRIERNRSGKNREEYYRTILLEEYRRHGLPTKKTADLVLEGSKSLKENAQIVIEKIANFIS